MDKVYIAQSQEYDGSTEIAYFWKLEAARSWCEECENQGCYWATIVELSDRAEDGRIIARGVESVEPANPN